MQCGGTRLRVEPFIEKLSNEPLRQIFQVLVSNRGTHRSSSDHKTALLSFKPPSKGSLNHKSTRLEIMNLNRP